MDLLLVVLHDLGNLKDKALRPHDLSSRSDFSTLNLTISSSRELSLSGDSMAVLGRKKTSSFSAMRRTSFLLHSKTNRCFHNFQSTTIRRRKITCRAADLNTDFFPSSAPFQPHVRIYTTNNSLYLN